MRTFSLMAAVLLSTYCAFGQNISLENSNIAFPYQIVSGTVNVSNHLHNLSTGSFPSRNFPYTATLNGIAVASLSQSPTTFSIDTTAVPDGTYALEYSHSESDINYVASILIVNNVPGEAALTQVPACGYYAGNGRGTSQSWGYTPPPCLMVSSDPVPRPGHLFPFLQATPYTTEASYSDIITEHVLPNNHLYGDLIRLWKSTNGENYVRELTVTGSRDYVVCGDIMDTLPKVDGPRDVATIGGCTTLVVHPVTGEAYFAVKASTRGRIGKIALDGTVTTLVGHRLTPGVVPYHPLDPLAPFDSQYQIMGDFSGFPTGALALPMDLSFDPADPNIAYVAVTGQGAIAKLDLSVNPVAVTLHKDGFDEPTSVMVGNGGVYVTERNLQQVVFINASGQTSVAANYPEPLINCRMALHDNGVPNSTHWYCLANSSGNVYHYNHQGPPSVLTTSPDADEWMWMDNGCAVGPCESATAPKFDRVCTVGAGPWETFSCYNQSTDSWNWHGTGWPESRMDQTSIGHYPWGVALGEDGSMWTVGFGTHGVQRMVLASSPSQEPTGVDLAKYEAGKRLWETGCGNGCAWGDAVGFSTTHGINGYGQFFPTVDDYAGMLIDPDPAAIDAAILAGLDTGVPRDFTPAELDDLKYFMLRSSALAVRGLSGGAPPPPPQNQPPVAVASAIPASGPVPLTVNFDGSASSDPDGDLLTYEWDFGDGSPVATGVTVSHTYAVEGTFTAVLTVSDGQAVDVDNVIIMATASTCQGAACCGAGTSWSGTACEAAPCPPPDDWELIFVQETEETGSVVCRIKP